MRAQSSWNRAAARGTGLCDFRRVPHEDMHRHMSLLLNSLVWIRVTFGRPGDHHSLATLGTVCTQPVSDKLSHLCLCVNTSSAGRFGFICNPEFGEGTDTPLQYSCLENPMDGGAWWAAVHRVAKSRTRLSDFTFTFHFHALEKEMATHSSVLAWRIPGTAEPGGLPSTGSHRVGHNWIDLAAATAVTLSYH